MGAFPTYAVVLAAGKGTRLHSALPKVLHPLCGRPMLEHILVQLRALSLTQILVVVGDQAEAVRARFSEWPVEWVLQEQQLGTGHAVLMSEPWLREKTGSVLVLYGDGPLITAARLRELLQAREKSDAALALITSRLDDPTGYGRVIRSPGKPLRIVEEKDASPEQKEIREANPGYYCFDLPLLFSALHRLSDDNVQGEYLLTDTVGVLSREGQTVVTIEAPAEEILGVNDLSEMARAEEILQRRVRTGNEERGTRND